MCYRSQTFSSCVRAIVTGWAICSSTIGHPRWRSHAPAKPRLLILISLRLLVAATSILGPAAATNAHATRVLIEDGRAVGVEYRTPAGLVTARCRREVIVSGGVYGSPQLLQLSGLGPATLLQQLGIPVRQALPAGEGRTNHQYLADHGRQRRRLKTVGEGIHFFLA